jgi:uncharacterized membrane protein YeaQ/YmgE (transglycosylase-associated protein family)
MYGTHEDAPGIIASTIGAVLLLAGYRALAGRRRRLF